MRPHSSRRSAGRQRLLDPGDVTHHLHPHGVPRAAAHREDAARAASLCRKGLDVVPYGKTHRFQERPIDVRPRVLKGEAQQGPPRIRVVQRRALAGEVRERHQPRAPGGDPAASSARAAYALPPPARSAAVGGAEIVPKPSREASRGRRSPRNHEALLFQEPGPQNPFAAISASVLRMKNVLLPYITIMSPGAERPALTASAAASAVPVMMGVPAAGRFPARPPR